MPFALICAAEAAVTESLRRLLGAEWTVFAASDAVGLQRALDETPADVVFIDEYVHGAELIDAVHAVRAGLPDATIVALALSMRTPRVAAALPAGLDEVLTKPFDRDALALVVHRALDRVRRGNAAPVRPGPAAAVAAGVGAADHATLTQALRTIFRAAANQTDSRQTAHLLLEALCELCGLNRGVILWRAGDAGPHRVLATQGVPRARLEALAFREETGLVAWLRLHNRVCVRDEPAAHLPTLVQQELQLLHAAIALPLVGDGHLQGVLALGNKLTGARFDAAELDLILCVGQYAATVLSHALAQEAARAQRALFKGVVASLASGVVMIDTDGRVQVMNAAAAQVLEVPVDGAVGQPAERLGSLVADLLRRTLAGEAEYRRHRVVNPATGQPMGINTSRLRDERGAAIGAIMVCTSLAGVAGEAEPAEAIETGRSDQETWGRFALGMAHAIKNPLVAIKTFAQLYPEHHADPDFTQNFHAVALHEVERLDQLVESLMRYGAAEEPERERCDLNDLVADVVARRRGGDEAGVAVDVEPAEEAVVTLADRHELGEAIAHVVTNAQEAAGAAGHVWVRARRSRNGDFRAVIEVEDSGPGFPDTAGARVFSPFFTTKEKGLGLGLALTELTARRHGGAVSIEKSDRGGAKVILRLPLAESGGA